MPHFICTEVDGGDAFPVTHFGAEDAVTEAHAAIWSRGGDYPEKVRFRVTDPAGNLIGTYESEVEMVPSFSARAVDD